MSEINERSFVHQQEKQRSLKVLHLPEVRVSSASFARIKDKSGRYALLVNKDRAKKGIIVLTPIGGVIEATPSGIEELKNLLGIDDSAFEKGNDLRFIMRGAKANEFRKWFLTDKQRESNPSREVYEELVDEKKLLGPEELEYLKYVRAGYATELAETTRAGQEGRKTLRLLEVFDVELESETLRKLVELSKDPNAVVIRFVTEKEIREGKTEDSIEIGSVAKSLLDIQKSIPEFV